MCEMLVRTRDKAPLDTPEAQARVSQRGDVIDICDDGWAWTYAERTNPDWTLVKLPGVDKEKMSAFLGSEPGDPLLNKYLRRRAFSFDIAGYQSGVIPKDQTQALAMKMQKPPVVDVAVIGADPKVIG